MTTGCTEGIAAALLGLVDPGDEVVVLEPYYDSYVAMIQMAGGVRRPVTLRAPDFRLDVDELRAAVTPRTRFVLLNSPHNPTGTVLTRDELAGGRRRGDRARPGGDHRRGLRAPDLRRATEHVPIATLPGMFERTLTLSSAGKSYSFTGWKVGWATGPAELVGAVLAAKQWLTFTSGLAAAAGGRARARRGAGLPARAGRATCRSAATCCCDGLAAVGLDVRRPRGHLLRHHRHLDARLGGRAWRSAWRCPSGPGWSRSRPRSSTTTRTRRGRHLVRWAFCKEPEVIEEARRLRRRPAPEPRSPDLRRALDVAARVDDDGSAA